MRPEARRLLWTGGGLVAAVALLRGAGLWALLPAGMVVGIPPMLRWTATGGPAWLPRAWRAVAALAALHLVLAALLWGPPWRGRWKAPWLPAAERRLPVGGSDPALRVAATRALTQGNAAGAVTALQGLVRQDPSAVDLLLLGRAELAAGQTEDPPLSLDTAAFLGAHGPDLAFALGQWYAHTGDPVGQLQAWTYYRAATRARPGDAAYAAAAAQALSAAMHGLRLGSWANS